jgi:inhibitor of cysteine peptidase
MNLMPSLTEADDGRSVDLYVGETVDVTLPENATTGYRWAIDRLDPGIVEANESKPRYPSGQVGNAGQVTFAFKATKAGSGEVLLKYWRHFEGDASVTKRFGIRLNAKS